jgi:hypothetical protein
VIYSHQWIQTKNHVNQNKKTSRITFMSIYRKEVTFNISFIYNNVRFLLAFIYFKITWHALQVQHTECIDATNTLFSGSLLPPYVSKYITRLMPSWEKASISTYTITSDTYTQLAHFHYWALCQILTEYSRIRSHSLVFTLMDFGISVSEVR